MIPLKIWFLLWSSFIVRALPYLNIDKSRSHGNLTVISAKLLNNHSTILMKQRKQKSNLNRTTIDFHNSGIDSYRSSWHFTDKNTIRVRFRLSESLLQTIVSTRFLVRHTRTNQIRTYDEQNEIINSTLTLYLHNIKHGRHAVCLFLYTSKFMRNPKHIFCQDVIFNFQKYGHHDIDSDEYGNTFVFLLTQYAIVIGMLCILQLVYAARKRRLLRTVCEKANALRNYMSENHHHLDENKSTNDLSTQTHALEFLIYNLSRNVLFNIDEEQQPIEAANEKNLHMNNETQLLRRQNRGNQKYLSLPNDAHGYSAMPSLKNRPTTVPTVKIDDIIALKDDICDENDFDITAYEEQHISFQSLSHILEESKPWVTRVDHNGNIKHSIVNSKPL